MATFSPQQPQGLYPVPHLLIALQISASSPWPIRTFRILPCSLRIPSSLCSSLLSSLRHAQPFDSLSLLGFAHWVPLSSILFSGLYHSTVFLFLLRPLCLVITSLLTYFLPHQAVDSTGASTVGLLSHCHHPSLAGCKAQS